MNGGRKIKQGDWYVLSVYRFAMGTETHFVLGMHAADTTTHNTPSETDFIIPNSQMTYNSERLGKLLKVTQLSAKEQNCPIHRSIF